MIIPREMRLIIPQGSDLDYAFQINGLSEDISHAITQVRDLPADDDVSGETLNTPVLDMRDNDENTYITINNSASPRTVSLHVGQSVIEAIEPSSNSDGLGYYWDLVITLSSGKKYVIFHGRAPVIKGVSRTS